jgi:hypothetical protein
MGCATSSAVVGDGSPDSSTPVGDAAPDQKPVSTTTLAKACHDNATTYCNQDDSCFHKGIVYSYGDVATCIAAIEPLCNFAVSVPDVGWTGDSLETCITARSATTCGDFLHGTNYPSSCLPRGGRADAANCLYGSQCQSGYCKIPSGQSCGVCVEWAKQGAACTTTSDCDPGLRCAGNSTCQPAVTDGATCDTAHPCSPELYCDPTSTKCTKPGSPPAVCDPTLGSADCDYFQAAYCDGTSKVCTPYGLANDGQACGYIMNVSTVCTGGEGCLSGICTAGGDQGILCDLSKGLNCKPALQCISGVCNPMTYTCN